MNDNSDRSENILMIVVMVLNILMVLSGFYILTHYDFAHGIILYLVLSVVYTKLMKLAVYIINKNN